MTGSNWKDIAGVVGIAAIVASLIFVGLELRQSQQTARNETDSVIFSSFLDMRDAENEYSDIWVRGNRGDELDESEMSIYQNLIRNRHSHAAWTFNFYRTLDSEAYVVPVVNLAGFLHKYTNAREVWQSLRADEEGDRRKLLPGPISEDLSEFNELVRADLARLDEANE